jgi:hypothetical protein
MQYPESTYAVVEQAWPEPGSLKPRGGHHLEPQGSRAYSSAVPRATPHSLTYCSDTLSPSAETRVWTKQLKKSPHARAAGWETSLAIPPGHRGC